MDLEKVSKTNKNWKRVELEDSDALRNLTIKEYCEKEVRIKEKDSENYFSGILIKGKIPFYYSLMNDDLDFKKIEKVSDIEEFYVLN